MKHLYRPSKKIVNQRWIEEALVEYADKRIKKGCDPKKVMDKARKKYGASWVVYCPQLEDKKYVLTYEFYGMDEIYYYISYQTGINEKNILLY